jgi:hypothetical protein
MYRVALLSLTLVFAAVSTAAAQHFDSGSTGADGAFNPSCTPTPCTVTMPLPASGVFHYTTVNVPAGVTVKYLRNAANTPVTLLGTGNVTIAGAIDVSGADGSAGLAGVIVQRNGGTGGPGGFDGGSGSNGIVNIKGGDGFGPGAGGGAPNQNAHGGGAGYGTVGTKAGTGGDGGAVYGASHLLPLVGGSGGGGQGGLLPSASGGGGGGGGGAILIATGTSGTPATITLSGAISAKGGNGAQGPATIPGVPGGGPGSGGAVRLVANTVTGGGLIDVASGAALNGGSRGGFGRIRVEAITNTATFTFTTSPFAPVPPPSAISSTVPTASMLANPPSFTITSVAGVGAPTTLTGSLGTPDFVLPAGTTSAVVQFAATQMPLGTTIGVTVKGQQGGVLGTATSSGLSGTVASSTASATIAVPTNQPSVISASATFTVLAAGGSGPIYADGEVVESVRVSTTLGGGTELTYVTVSGREFVVAAAR